MANGLFHAKPSSQRYAQTKGGAKSSSLFDDDDPQTRGSRSTSGLGVKSAHKPRKGDEPGPEHHAAAARLLKRRHTIDPDSINDPKLREAYVSQLGDEANGVLTKEQLADVAAGKRNANGDKETTVGGIAKGAGRGVAGAGAKAGAAGGGAVNNGAGFLLGVIAYALVAAYLQGGPAEARQWLAAKFLNRAANPSRTAAGTSTPPGRPDNNGNPDGISAASQAAGSPGGSTYSSQVPKGAT